VLRSRSSLRHDAPLIVTIGVKESRWTLNFLQTPVAYLCNRLAINAWYGNPSARARFWIASRFLLDRRMFSRRSLRNVGFA
jgi:hypothetical protein